MEYVYYVSIILAILAVCYYMVRVPPEEVQLSRDAEVEPEVAPPLSPDVSGIPVPWGWPGSDIEHHYAEQDHDHTVSDSLHRWVDQLVATKTTVEDEKNRLRRESSMRALLEDRFVSPSHMAEIEYRKVKPTLLRDPSQPHDQMDNFPSGKLQKAESKLNGQPGVRTVERHGTGGIRYEDVKEVRTPWGW